MRSRGTERARRRARAASLPVNVPDSPEAVVGWRAWHLVGTGAGARLHAVGRPVVWEPGVAHDAACLRRRRWRERFAPRPAHAAPAWDCTCGIWAVRTLSRVLTALDVYGRAWKPLHRVIGTVALWGELVEHDGGWRAGHAYPTRLYVPARRLYGPAVEQLDAFVDALGAYGVPVRVLDAGSRAQIKGAVEADRPASGTAPHGAEVAVVRSAPSCLGRT